MIVLRPTDRKYGPIADLDWEEIWQHFDQMQQRAMHDKTTRDEFFEQPEDERLEFYRWLQDQAGEYACYM